MKLSDFISGRKKKKRKRVFLICPVRGITDEEKGKIGQYVARLERKGYEVYWPLRDTDQNDPVGLRICEDNLWAIAKAHEVHVWWSGKSQGSFFDLGMVFALNTILGAGKKVVLANPESVKETPEKSFQNFLLAISENQDKE